MNDAENAKDRNDAAAERLKGADDQSAAVAETSAPADAAAPPDGPAPAEEPAAEEPAVEEPAAEDLVAALEAQIVELRDQLIRAVAETENVRKRSERQIADTHKYAVANFAKDLLNVADNLRRAVEVVPAVAAGENELLKNLLTGVEAVERELIAAFDKHGIVKLTPLHDRFDPNFHQAMFEVRDSGKPPGTVVQLLQPGYLLADRLLRPAMVGVAKGDTEEVKVDTTV